MCAYRAPLRVYVFLLGMSCLLTVDIGELRSQGHAHINNH